MYKTIVVDDQALCREGLISHLSTHFNQFEIIASCSSGREGLDSIRQFQPDLVFLDIEMPGMDGFEMLDKIDHIDFDVVITTGHDKHALKAIHAGSLDFLVKPINLPDLQDVVSKFEKRLEERHNNRVVRKLMQDLSCIRNLYHKISLPVQDGLIMVPVHDIVRLESEANYTRVILNNGNRELVCRTLKDFENILLEFNFIRVHHSHLVNPFHIKRFVRSDGGYLLMSDNASVSISSRKKQEILKKISSL